MKQKLFYLILLMTGCLMHFALFSQAVSNVNWPREITLENGGKITIYQPQPESLSGNKLSARAAVSIKKTSKAEPVFGAIWADAILQTDKDRRTATLESVTIIDAKFPSIDDSSQLQNLKETLEREIPNWKMEISLDELVASLDQNGIKGSTDLKNDPPEIIYTTQPSALIVIDGEPIVAMDNDLKMERVNNSPFLIVKNPDDKKYYLYGGKFWYSSSSITAGWKSISSLPKRIKALDEQIKKQEKENAEKDKDQATAKKDEPASPPAVIVRTAPAELIQSNGEAAFKSVEGTSLLYMSNTDNDIFKDINTQENYVLLSGRWYKSNSLSGPWTYVEADKLPPDYAKIPEGSDKDGVLASVAGTDEAREAVLDASIPQTAKVDRKTATTKVEYDGDPAFSPVEGTDMQYATNTSGTILLENAKYYAVDNGVWFESDKPNGPWRVSANRPNDVEKIPPGNPTYNTRYVYIYDQTPEYIYVGYTPGYLNSYIYRSTVVYGTGWYYRPWWRRYYYPRPVTWGFGMHYNPWTGFSMSMGFYMGFFNFTFGHRPWGGWFGPPAYRPPYRPPHWGGGWNGGYYGHNRPVRPGILPINRPRPAKNNNLYNNHRGVTTRDVAKRPGGNRLPNTKPATGNPGNRLPVQRPGIQNPVAPGNRLPGNNNQPGIAPPNRLPNKPAPTREARPSREPDNVFADKSGNIFQRDKAGNFQERDKSGWKPVTPGTNPSLPQIQKDNRMRDRGDLRTNNFRQQSPATSRPAPAARPPAVQRPADAGKRMPAPVKRGR